MELLEKSRNITEIFKELERKISLFKDSTGIECIESCRGECCNNEDITSTILEFIPLTFHLHLLNKAEKIYHLLDFKEDKICVLFDREAGGKCKYYEYRGLICRLFGFSSVRLKDNTPSIVTCKFIKNRHVRAIRSQLNPIIMADYQRRLISIDIELGSKFYPINEAIKRAIEKTGLYLNSSSTVMGIF